MESDFSMTTIATHQMLPQLVVVVVVFFGKQHTFARIVNGCSMNQDEREADYFGRVHLVVNVVNAIQLLPLRQWQRQQTSKREEVSRKSTTRSILVSRKEIVREM
jgi:predicted DNA-binding protein (UPF0251 family)